ncbi:MAG: hypothetical protein J6K24_00320 [Tidjanibacter sp.]|nr:hypothetical protein [Tidjanibacter sp.]
MKKLLYIIPLLLGIIMTSCSTTYYQVFSVTPENATMTENGSPTYTKDGLQFTYNFWGENGSLNFIIYNSNDYDIIVDLTKSSFIRNNIAEDYYQGKQIETRIATGVYSSSKYGTSVITKSEVPNGKLNNYMGHTYDATLALNSYANTYITLYGQSAKKEWQTAIIYKEPEQVRIPAKSAKAFGSFNINNILITGSRFRAETIYNPTVFNRHNTPLQMRNRICIYKEGESPMFYEMDFYISGIGNVINLPSSSMTPTNFYIPYSSELDSVNAVESDLFGSNISNQTTISPAAEEEDKSQEWDIHIGSIIRYKGRNVTICNILEDKLMVAAFEERGIGTQGECLLYCKQMGEEWMLPEQQSEFESIIEIMEQCDKYIYLDYWSGINEEDNKALCYNTDRCKLRSKNIDNSYAFVPIAYIMRPN